MSRNVEFVAPDDTAQAAAEKMEMLNVGFVPVCNEDKHVLGVVTDRDIAVRIVAHDKSPSTPVREFMTTEIVACEPEDDLAEATRLMRQRHKARVLCLDADGRLAGIVSLSDVAQLDDAKTAAETLRAVTEREAPTVRT